MRGRSLIPLASACLLAFVPPARAQAPAGRGHNYAEALQKSLYFFEAQQSGRLSPNNRVEWRGDACLTDGRDVGTDLSGGWFDAGDHWTANATMAFAATTLAWSAVECPQGYLKSGQMDELLESLVHVNRYFLKCVLNPDAKDPAIELDVVIGCGGREGVPPPDVHAMWAPAEVAHLMTNRPTFRVNRRAPAGDVPAAMAAAMAASSMVVREHGALLKGEKGYADFDPPAFADLLLDRAEKLLLFARANAGPALADGLDKEQRERITQARESALRSSDGKVVRTGYRSGPFDKIFAAATFIERAHRARGTDAGGRWADLAEAVYDNEFKAEHLGDWWRDFGAGNMGHLGAYNMVRLKADRAAAEKYHGQLQLYAVSFTKYRSTPGGLKLREWFAHEYGSLRHANNAAVIALYYSRLMDEAPVLRGNTWWKNGKTDAEWKQQMFADARRQVDYALGDNPYGRSFLVGYGVRPFNAVHHRGAHGPWAGFHHFIKAKPEYRPDRNRHVLYGALVAGPDHNDLFLCGDEHTAWLPTRPDGTGHDFFYKFPGRPEPVLKKDWKWEPHEPLQLVMDSKLNEVALDYNAGITASFALLTAEGLSAGGALADAQFPPKEARDENTDLLTTDREFFAAARDVRGGGGGAAVEVTAYNRSRWPARIAADLSFRYYFTTDGPTRPADVKVALASGDGGVAGPVTVVSGKLCYVEVKFPGIPVFPGDRDRRNDSRRATLTFDAPAWDAANDPSARGVGPSPTMVLTVPVYDAGRLVGGQEPA